MNRQQFFQWMNDPASLNEESAGELQELAANYPYFQTARILNLMNLKLLKDYRFEQELRRVAALAADRARLRDWLVMLESGPEKADRQADKTGGDLIPAADREKDIHLRALEEQIKASLKEIEIRKSRLRELIEEKKAVSGDHDQQADELTELDKGMAFRPLPKDKMLEDFILQKEGEAQQHASFFNPEESARRSLEENDDILSETLARLVAAQGKKDKAIKIYQKLMLKYPQKSSYFAAQIEKLRKES